MIYKIVEYLRSLHQDEPGKSDADDSLRDLQREMNEDVTDRRTHESTDHV